MDDLRKNGSGYYDKTAFQAMKNYEKEKREMKCKRGEIWEVATMKGFKTSLVIQTYEGDGYATIIQLVEESGDTEGRIEVCAPGLMYGSVGRMQYRYEEDFQRYIRTMTEEEMEKVLKKIRETLRLETEEKVKEVTCNIGGDKKEMEKAAKKAVEQIRMLRGESGQEFVGGTERRKLEMELTKAEKEAEIYKGMYEKILEKVTAYLNTTE